MKRVSTRREKKRHGIDGFPKDGRNKKPSAKGIRKIRSFTSRVKKRRGTGVWAGPSMFYSRALPGQRVSRIIPRLCYTGVDWGGRW